MIRTAIMLLYEHQGKELLKRFRMIVPRSILISSDQALPLTNGLGCPSVIIKSQVLSGRRGVRGGIIQCSFLEVSKVMERILETSPRVHPSLQKIDKLLIEERINIGGEVYLSLMISRREQSLLLLVSDRGGINIELSIVTKLKFNAHRLYCYRLYDVTKRWKLRSLLKLRLGKLVIKLCCLLLTHNLLLVEINPLAISGGRLVIIDSKIESEFRLHSLSLRSQRRDCLTSGLSRERRAEGANVSYVQIGKGTVGCLANGAGLAMATIDMIAVSNQKPLNFLDMKGKSSIKKIGKALSIILTNNNLRSILINIFGGIICCFGVAKGLLNATAISSTIPPLLIRMEGTGRKHSINAFYDANYKSVHVAPDFFKVVRGVTCRPNGPNVW